MNINGLGVCNKYDWLPGVLGASAVIGLVQQKSTSDLIICSVSPVTAHSLHSSSFSSLLNSSMFSWGVKGEVRISKKNTTRESSP